MAVLTKTDNISIPHVLSFDGSYIGKYNFLDVVSWCHPSVPNLPKNKTMPLYALLKLGDSTYPVMLKRNCSKRTDQAVLDELKPIFGIEKIGTHRITLKGIPSRINPDGPWIYPNGVVNTHIKLAWSEYYVFRTPTTTNEFGQQDFVIYPILEDISWCPSTTSGITDKHKQFFYEIQKILIFRDIFNIPFSNLKNIVVKIKSSKETDPIKPISINENSIGNTSGIPKQLLTFFFPTSNTKVKILIKMLGMTKDKYRDQIEIIRNTMSSIIMSIDDVKLPIVDSIISKIVDRVSVYYSLNE